MDSDVIVFAWFRGPIMDLILRKDKVFVHSGIVVDGLVYHFSSINNSFFDVNKQIRCNTVDEFSRNRPIRLYNLPECNEDSLKRLYYFKNFHKKYNLIFNNCYSLVLFCIKGRYSFFNLLKFCFKYKVSLVAIFNRKF